MSSRGKKKRLNKCNIVAPAVVDERHEPIQVNAVLTDIRDGKFYDDGHSRISFDSDTYVIPFEDWDKPVDISLTLHYMADMDGNPVMYSPIDEARWKAEEIILTKQCEKDK
jgi:hypothetical protein